MSEDTKLDRFVGRSVEGNESKSEEWQTRSLGELAEYQNGRSFSKSEWGSSGYPIIRIQNLTNNQEDFNYYNGELEEKYRVNPGDTLLSWSATIDLFNWSGPEAALNQHIFRIDSSEDVNNTFYRFELEHLLPRLEALSHGSTMKHVRKADLVNVDTSLPPLEEQRKIATVLYTVDQAIQKTEEIVSQLTRVKQGSYRNLFSNGYESHSDLKPTKYGEIPNNWNVSKLSEITTQIQAGGTPDTDVAEYYEGEIPWVKTGELSQYRVTETEQSITEKGLNESAARLFSPDTVLIAMYGATTGEVSQLEIEAATNQACCGVITTEKMLPGFLFHQLKYLSDYLVSLSAGSGQQNISKGILEKFDIIVPSVHEQESILDVLNSIDESIAKSEGSKKQLQRLKQGLMQDLLSGAIRTDDVDIEVLDDVLSHG